ncbi:MAG: helix-turn-helix transcriptional regulator [Anaerolineales bacterium]|nr:helix-turn-helix transcriptional regulator [Anaerolineales bacterium]
MSREISRKKTSQRKYDSSGRQAQALESHAQIIKAARELFIESGYSGVSIEAIARKAKTSPETIYSVFRNKRTILSRAMDLASGMDGSPSPLCCVHTSKKLHWNGTNKSKSKCLPVECRYSSHTSPLLWKSCVPPPKPNQRLILCSKNIWMIGFKEWVFS